MFVTFRYFDGSLGGASLRMNFPAVAAAIADIDEAVGAMETSLSDLNQSLRTKLVDWEGGAFGSYAETEATWNTAANDIKTLLFSIRNAVEGSSERMAITEMNNAAALARSRA